MKSIDTLIDLFIKSFPKDIDLTKECDSNNEYWEWFWDEYADSDQRQLLFHFWEDFAKDIYDLLKNGK